MRRFAAAALFLLTILVLAPLADVATASTVTVRGRTVGTNGVPKKAKVAITYTYAVYGQVTTIHLISNVDGWFETYVEGASIVQYTGQAYQGVPRNLTTPENGVIDFGNLMTGDCRGCPLPPVTEDGSGNP